MASTELDPLFLKGLRLLHSKSKDSTEQLKQLLDEAIAQSLHASKEQNYFLKSESDTKIHLKKRDYSDFSSLSSSKQLQDDDRGRKREHSEKRHLDRSKQDDIEIIQEKIPKLDSPQLITYRASSPDIPRLDHFITKKVEDDSDSSDEAADADGFAMEMGLACVICKSLDVTAGNQLIECQECHSLYHQECHRPPATDYDINDPRRVWYCAKCTKNMKKIASKPQKTTKPSTSIPPKDVPTQTRFTKPDSAQSSSVLPFKRQELKAPVSSQVNNHSSSNKPIGLAGLAANFSSRVTTAASSVSSSSRPISSKNTLPNSLKSYSNLNSPIKTTINNPLSLSSTSKLSSGNSNSSSSSGSSVSFGAALQSASAVPPIVISKSANTSSSTSSLKTGLGIMAASASLSSRQASSSLAPNNGAKPTATCSLLMTADKRVQSMKKRAAKMQEKRRLVTK